MNSKNSQLSIAYRFLHSYRTQAMIANIRASFASLVMENDWMDADTKQIAIDKVIDNQREIDKYSIPSTYRTQ